MFRLVDLLKEKYAPKDQMAVVKRTRKMNVIKIKNGMDPSQLFR